MLHNLLPEFKTIKRQKNFSKQANWRPEASNPCTAQISSCLEHEFTKPEPILDYYEEPLPAAEPNKKYTTPLELSKLDESQISAVNRGVNYVDSFNYTSEVKRLGPKLAKRDNAFSNFLVLQLMNVLPMKLDLFLQRNSAINDFVVSPHSSCLKYVQQCWTLC